MSEYSRTFGLRTLPVPYLNTHWSNRKRRSDRRYMPAQKSNTYFQSDTAVAKLYSRWVTVDRTLGMAGAGCLPAVKAGGQQAWDAACE